MCSVSGHDASGRVDDLVAQQNKQCTAIAIGKYIAFDWVWNILRLIAIGKYIAFAWKKILLRTY